MVKGLESYRENLKSRMKRNIEEEDERRNIMNLNWQWASNHLPTFVFSRSHTAI